ncbi:MAG: PEP-CTERM sorting domain-containing protein [Planctomycetota bacterium]
MLGLTAPLVHAFEDNFDDGTIAPAWTLLHDAPGQLDLLEQDGRLDVFANNPSSNAIDALYLSNGPAGFRLDTGSDFEITLDYNLTNFDSATAVIGDNIGLTLGVGRDLDGNDSAAIGFGATVQSLLGNPFLGTALVAGYRVDDIQTEQPLTLFGPEIATFRIAYDAAGDDLTLGVTDPAQPVFVLQDTVRGLWEADELFMSFGARGGGFVFGPGDAWLDHFRVVSGNLLPLTNPLPGDFDGNGSVEQGDLNLVLNNWGSPRTDGGGDWANAQGFASLAVDQEELNRVLNNWGSQSAPTLSANLVPEPASAIGLIGLCGWFGLCRRIKSRSRPTGPKNSLALTSL